MVTIITSSIIKIFHTNRYRNLPCQSIWSLTIFCKKFSLEHSAPGNEIKRHGRGFRTLPFLKGNNTFTIWFHFIYYRSMWSVIYAYLFWGDTDTDNGMITDDHTLLIISDRPRVSSNTGGAFQPSTQLITLRPRTINTGEKTATSYVITCTWSLNLSM